MSGDQVIGDQVAVAELFDDERTATKSRKERLYATLDRSFIAPLRILWSDLRTRIGVAILTFFTLMGTVGVWMTEPTYVNEHELLVGWFHEGWFTIGQTSVAGLEIPWPEIILPLGTDGLGRDMLILIVHATPAMLKMITAGAVFTVAVATMVGTLSGYLGGTRIDSYLMFVTDVMMTIPGLPLVIVITSILEPQDPVILGILLSINAWSGLARALRSEVLSLRSVSYVEASRALGVPTWTILFKDILPNLMSYILISFANSARGIIYGSVGLYFLGVLPVSEANWGVILNDAPSYAIQFGYMRHWVMVPLLTVMAISIGLILFAQGADRLFNPKIRARHAKSVGSEPGEEGPSDEDSETTIGTQTGI